MILSSYHSSTLSLASVHLPSGAGYGIGSPASEEWDTTDVSPAVPFKIPVNQNLAQSFPRRDEEANWEAPFGQSVSATISVPVWHCGEV